MSGTPTAEFWEHALEHMYDLEDHGSRIHEVIKVSDGKIYVSPEQFVGTKWPFDGHDPLYRFEKEVFFHSVAKHAARGIWDKRRASGVVNRETMKEFAFIRRLSKGPPDWPHPDECDFMEELIMKGGRFASE